MSLVRLRVRAATAALVTIALSSAALPNSAPLEASWSALTDEPSRADLFQDYARKKFPSASIGKLAFVFPYGFQFPVNALHDLGGAVRKDQIFGIDISHYQGAKFPVGLLKSQHVSFIYVKATQGTTCADKQFGSNWTALAALPEATHIPRGAYHFLSSAPTESGTDQANRFLAYVALHGGFAAGDLPPTMDLEWDRTCRTCEDRWSTNHRSAGDIIATARAFLARVHHATGRVPLIYTNKSFLADHGMTDAQIASLTSGYRVWIFDINPKDLRLELPDPKANLAHSLWQFSWRARLSEGYGQTLNVDYFNGSEASLKEKLVNAP